MSSHTFRLQPRLFHLSGSGRFLQPRLLCMSSAEPPCGEEVVISGISCRLPSCDNFSEFSKNLRDGKDMVAEQTRFQSVRVPRRMGLLRRLDKFDAAFFRTPPKLAETSDPQIRMLLEVAFETIVDAGYSPQALSGQNIGVFVAAAGGETFDHGCLTYVESESDGYKVLGSGGCMIANQISYAFNFQGTSVLLSAGCCSSMVAFETAVAAIRDGRIDAAIVGACCVHLSPLSSVEFASLGAVSPDGICRAFDDSANGFVRSEAIVALFLQRKRDARRLRALVRAVATNHDGYKPQGIPCPDSQAQVRLLEKIYPQMVDPNEVSFLEAHGTGTPAGDPEELEAFSAVFCNPERLPTRTSPLLIGSVKSSLGHTEAAAGLSSIAKVLTIFQSGIIPPNLYYEAPNRRCLHLEKGTMKVVSQPTPFPGGLVGISSLSIGGVNGHVVLEPWYSSRRCIQDSPSPRIVFLSGRSGRDMQDLLEANTRKIGNPEFRQLMYSAFSTPVAGHNYRGYGILVGENQRNLPKCEVQVARFSPKPYTVWYVFGGLGFDLPGFSNASRQSYPPFTRSLQAAISILKNRVGMDLVEILGSNRTVTGDDVQLGFLALAAVQIAFVDALRSLAVEPDGFIGYSIGEIACGYADGCLTKEEALLLSYYQGASYKEAKATDGSMAVVSLPWDEALERCRTNVYPVCKNAEDNVTVAGNRADVERFVEQLSKEGIHAREVQSYGITPHVPKVNDELFSLMLKYFECTLKGSSKPRSDRWISSSFLQSQRAVKSCAQYYVNNLKSPVLFYDALMCIPKDAIVIEIGLSAHLNPYIKQSIPSSSVLSATNEQGTDQAVSFLKLLGELYNLGVNMDFAAMLPHSHVPASSCAPDLGQLVTWDHSDSWSTFVVSYPKNLSPTVSVDIRHPKWSFIRGHKINDIVVFPATGYIYLAWKVFADKHGANVNSFPVEFHSVNFRRMTVVDASRPVHFQFDLLSGSGQFEIHENGELVVEGSLRKAEPFPEELFRCPAVEKQPKILASLSSNEFYKEAYLRGYNFSDDFRSIIQADMEGGWADVEWKENWITFLDGMLQTDIPRCLDRTNVIPISLHYLAMDPVIFFQHIRAGSPKGIHPVRVFLDGNSSTAYGPGIRLSLPPKHESHIKRRPQEPVLLQEVFAPFFTARPEASSLAWWEILDLITENLSTLAIKILVLTSDIEHARWKEIVSILGNQSRLKVQVLKSKPEDFNVNARGQTSCEVVIIDNQNTLAQACQISQNFVLCVSVSPEVVQCSHTRRDHTNEFVTVAEKIHGNEKLSLLKKRRSHSHTTKMVAVHGENFEWLPAVQKAVADAEHQRDCGVCLWTTDAEHECGIVGLARCLRKEPGGEGVFCVVMQSALEAGCAKVPEELEKTLENGLAINVCRDGEWGSYAHIPVSRQMTGEKMTNVLLCNPQKDGVAGAAWVHVPMYKQEQEQRVVVSYAGLNFHDILMANGTLPDAHNSLGHLGVEFSGYDSNGKRVMGLTSSGGVGTHVLPTESWQVPDSWSLEDAATVPLVYSTILWGLLEQANLRAGQSVLIHSGAGGTGQAGIQVALALGCKVFTTIGAPEKAEYLLEMYPELSRERIGSSNDTSFADMIMTATKGRGVDVALNSLTGDLVEATLRCVAKSGKFIDLSANHMVHDTIKLKTRPFFNNVSYHGLVLTQLDKDGEDGRRLKRLVQDAIDSGLVVPLPRTVYPMQDAVKALQNLQQRNHVGKMLVSMEDSIETLNSVRAEPRIYFHAEGTYIVVGGLGGIGFELVLWLVTRGARHVSILSRTGELNGYHAYNMQRLKTVYNATVEVIKGDLSDEQNCKDALIKAENSHGVAGIFITSLVLKDGPIADLTHDDFHDVCRPKAGITKHLDAVSRKFCKNVEYFVVMSSAVGCYGMGFQSNYGYANVMADRICETRRKMGYHALALQIGVVADVGYVAERLFSGKRIPSDFNPCCKPQTIWSVLDSLENALLLEISTCSSLIPGLSSTAAPKASLLRRVLKIMGLQDAGELDLSVKLKDLGIDSLSSSMIRQILLREYKATRNVAKVGDLTLLDIIAVENEKTE